MYGYEESFFSLLLILLGFNLCRVKVNFCLVDRHWKRFVVSITFCTNSKMNNTIFPMSMCISCKKTNTEFVMVLVVFT